MPLVPIQCFAGNHRIYIDNVIYMFCLELDWEYCLKVFNIFPDVLPPNKSMPAVTHTPPVPPGTRNIIGNSDAVARSSRWFRHHVFGRSDQPPTRTTMSSTRRHAAFTSTGTTNHKCYTSDEFQRWHESHAKIAAITFKEAGVQVIDFNISISS
jgi:hypothetical protein